jgi:murein L,D-transpeptidase YcbB/YkuD
MTSGMTPKHSKELIKTWEKDKSLRDSMQKHVQKDKHFQLDSMLPVYLVYFTAYRGPQNKVSFAQDSYKRDIQVQKALQLVYQRRIYPAKAAALH